MKTKILAIALASILLSLPAWATKPAPQPDPGNTSSSNSSSSSNSNSSASAGAVGVGVGIGVGGQGGEGGMAISGGGLGIGEGGTGIGGSGHGGSAQGGQGGDAASYNALANDINYASSMRSISLANPVWTLIPQAGGKCTVSNSSAESLVFGVWSGSRSRQATDAECAMMQMSNNYRQSCQFKTAAMIDKTLFERFNSDMSGDFLLADTSNLTPVQCADLLKPRLIMDTRIQQAPVSVAPSNVDVHVECAQPVRQVSAPVRRPVAKKPARACPKE